jgi:alanyl-tRNA synthetase
VHGRLAQFEAAELADRAETVGSMRVVAAALAEWDQSGLKAIASAIASRPGHVAVLFSTPGPSAVVLARAADVAVDCAAALRALVGQFGGKGGGRPELAQGGGLQGSADALVQAARSLWSGPQ